MGPKYHYLNCEIEEYIEIEKDRKKFVIVKDSQDYEYNDRVYLRETANGKETGRVRPWFSIKYIERNADGLSPGYCILC